jgi:hypothetical protein
MPDRIESPPGYRILEYLAAQRFAIETTLCIENLSAKSFNDLHESWRAGLDDFAGDHICVDDGHPEFFEPLGYRALSACNAAGKADSKARDHGLMFKT